MNLDLLKKLTRLANSNPNDNEANSAARKVCKMLEAGNWVLEVKVQSKVQPKQARTWNDVTRSQEPQWKSQPFTNPPNSSDWFHEFFKNRQYRSPEWDKYTYEWETKPDPFNNPFRTDPPKPEWKDLECTTCRKVIKTRFVGTPASFICNDCVWKAYNERDVQEQS